MSSNVPRLSHVHMKFYRTKILFEIFMLSNLVLFLVAFRLYFILKRYLNFKFAIVALAGAAAAVWW